MNAAESDPSTPGRAPTRRKRSRSAVTSGRRLFVAGDPSSPWSRRYSDVLAAHIRDLAGSEGDADDLSQAQLSLCRRAAALTVECEQWEGRASQGDAIDLDAFGRAASHLRRILETLGVERAPKPPMSLDDYIRTNYPPKEGQAQ